LCQHAFVGDDVVGPTFIALHGALGLGQKRLCEVRRLDECPGEILLPFLTLLALLLAIAGVHAANAARIGRKVADVGEPIELGRFPEE